MAKRPGMDINLSSVDDLFGGIAPEAGASLEKVVDLPLAELDHFNDHPYSVTDDKEMQDIGNADVLYNQR